MRFSFRFLAFLLLLILTHFQNGIAQEATGNRLSARIAQAKAAGTEFLAYDVFKIGNGKKHPQTLKQETSLTLQTAALQRLYASHPAALSLRIPTESGKVYELELTESHPFASNVTAGYIAADGQHTQTDASLGIHYQGAVAGAARSFAAVSVFAHGEIRILFADEAGNYVVGKLADASGDYVFYNDQDFLVRPPMSCGTKDDDALPQQTGKDVAHKSAAITGCNKVELYWEIDYQLYTDCGSLAATNTYVATLMNHVQTLYANDGVALELKRFYVYTTPDGYPENTSGAALYAFKDKWNGLNNQFGANLAHLITKDNSRNGGVAYRDVLCSSPDFAYAYSEIKNTFSGLPTFTWDVEVVTHETGHNLGSRHTHWCGWNTGPGGSCGSIDNCTTQETTSSCTTCGQTYDDAAPSSSWKGTIMSYCHLVSRGINLVNGFGPLPGAVIQNSVANASCVSPTLNMTLLPTAICNTNDGAVAVSPASNNLGTAPYAYQWTSGGTSPNLSNISTPGTYSVSVTDANGCNAFFNANVAYAPKPGNGVAYAGQMPINCASNTPVRISATAPGNLSACETVAWLRTTTPVISLAAAQTAFNAAAPTDVLFSTNTTPINSSTPAYLDAMQPATCTSAVSYYYTPFVSQKTKPARTVTQTASVYGDYSVDNMTYTMGQAGYLDDSSGTVGICDTRNTPTTQQLNVTVSSYTGRPNRLSIIAINPTTGIPLKMVTGLAGNGIYTVSLAGIEGSPLQEMLVYAIDFNVDTTNYYSSTCNLSVARTVVYPAITKPTFEAACNTGTSVMLSYAPGGFPPLDVAQTAFTSAGTFTLFPNPASQQVRLQLQSAQREEIRVRIQSRSGQIVYEKALFCNAGNNEWTLPLTGFAKGLYFVTVGDKSGALQTQKLLVE